MCSVGFFVYSVLEFVGKYTLNISLLSSDCKSYDWDEEEGGDDTMEAGKAQSKTLATARIHASCPSTFSMVASGERPRREPGGHAGTSASSAIPISGLAAEPRLGAGELVGGPAVSLGDARRAERSVASARRARQRGARQAMERRLVRALERVHELEKALKDNGIGFAAPESSTSSDESASAGGSLGPRGRATGGDRGRLDEVARGLHELMGYVEKLKEDFVHVSSEHYALAAHINEVRSDAAAQREAVEHRVDRAVSTLQSVESQRKQAVEQAEARVLELERGLSGMDGRLADIAASAGRPTLEVSRVAEELMSCDGFVADLRREATAVVMSAGLETLRREVSEAKASAAQLPAIRDLLAECKGGIDGAVDRVVAVEVAQRENRTAAACLAEVDELRVRVALACRAAETADAKLRGQQTVLDELQRRPGVGAGSAAVAEKSLADLGKQVVRGLASVTGRIEQLEVATEDLGPRAREIQEVQEKLESLEDQGSAVARRVATMATDARRQKEETRGIREDLDDLKENLNEMEAYLLDDDRAGLWSERCPSARSVGGPRHRRAGTDDAG